MVHKSYFEDESLAFRHGIGRVFSIGSKIINADGDIITVDKGEFPLSILEILLTEQGSIDHAVFGGPFSFIDRQFDLYQFRSHLAQRFADALSGGKNKRSFRFDLHSQPEHFHVLVT